MPTIPRKSVCDYSQCNVALEKNKLGGLYCSEECRKLGQSEKLEKTCLERYGVKNPALIESSKIKKMATVIQKYGVPYILQSPEILAKVKATNLNRYGVECVSSSKEIKEKKHKTNLERYGIAELFDSEEFQQKMRQCMKDKYGVVNYAQLHFPKETLEKLDSKTWLTEQVQIKTVALIAEELDVDYKLVWHRVKKYDLIEECAKLKKELRLLKENKIIELGYKMATKTRRFCVYAGCKNPVTLVYGIYCSEECRNKGQSEKMKKANKKNNGEDGRVSVRLTEEEKKLKAMVSMFPKPPKKD